MVKADWKKQAMAKLSVDQTLSRAKSYAKRGEVEKAQKLYHNVLQAFPKNGRAQKGLASLKIVTAPTIAQNPPQELLDKLLGDYQTERFSDAEKLATFITQEFPNHQFAWKVLGTILEATGRKTEALNANQKAVALSPKDAEVHNNLGITLKKLGRLAEAKASYVQAIALKPDYAEAHHNLGDTLHELGRLEEAGASYAQAIALKSDYAEAHHNLGITFHKLGRLEEALASYEQAIASKPGYAIANLSLLQLLTCYNSQKKSSLPIINADQEIKEIELSEESARVLSDDKIIDLFHKSSNIIEKYALDLSTNLSQAYRRNSVDLNCRRHKQIFKIFSIIPEFCFGCYKVQIEPQSIIELIKLFVLFDQIKLPKNNTRKCMIEMRSKVSGFYKGLIYCTGLEEANQIADYLDMVVKERFGFKLPLVVKRGCAEYPEAFPDYSAINKSGAQLMNYNEDWKLTEDDYDSKNPTIHKGVIQPSLSCLSLQDVLIIRNWIDYAKGIGDSGSQLLTQQNAFSQRVFRIAKARLETYPWREAG